MMKLWPKKTNAENAVFVKHLSRAIRTVFIAQTIATSKTKSETNPKFGSGIKSNAQISKRQRANIATTQSLS